MPISKNSAGDLNMNQISAIELALYYHSKACRDWKSANTLNTLLLGYLGSDKDSISAALTPQDFTTIWHDLKVEKPYLFKASRTNRQWPHAHRFRKTYDAVIQTASHMVRRSRRYYRQHAHQHNRRHASAKRLAPHTTKGQLSTDQIVDAFKRAIQNRGANLTDTLDIIFDDDYVDYNDQTGTFSSVVGAINDILRALMTPYKNRFIYPGLAFLTYAKAHPDAFGSSLGQKAVRYTKYQLHHGHRYVLVHVTSHRVAVGPVTRKRLMMALSHPVGTAD